MSEKPSRREWLFGSRARETVPAAQESNEPEIDRRGFMASAIAALASAVLPASPAVSGNVSVLREFSAAWAAYLGSVPKLHEYSAPMRNNAVLRFAMRHGSLPPTSVATEGALGAMRSFLAAPSLAGAQEVASEMAGASVRLSRQAEKAMQRNEAARDTLNAVYLRAQEAARGILQEMAPAAREALLGVDRLSRRPWEERMSVLTSVPGIRQEDAEQLYGLIHAFNGGKEYIGIPSFLENIRECQEGLEKAALVWRDFAEHYAAGTLDQFAIREGLCKKDLPAYLERITGEDYVPHHTLPDNIAEMTDLRQTLLRGAQVSTRLHLPVAFSASITVHPSYRDRLKESIAELFPQARLSEQGRETLCVEDAPSELLHLLAEVEKQREADIVTFREMLKDKCVRALPGSSRESWRMPAAYAVTIGEDEYMQMLGLLTAMHPHCLDDLLPRPQQQDFPRGENGMVITVAQLAPPLRRALESAARAQETAMCAIGG